MRALPLFLGLALLLAWPAEAGHRGDDWGYGWKHSHGWKHGPGWKHGHGWGPPHRRHGGAVVVLRPAPYYVYRSYPEVVVVERPVVVAPPPGVVLGPEVHESSGRYCREYRTTGRIGGRSEELWGVACLKPDGTWELSG